MSSDPNVDLGPIPLTPKRRDCGRLALVVSNLGIPYVGQLVPIGRGLGWVGIWGIFKGRIMRAGKDCEGRWLDEGDTIDLDGKRELVVVAHEIIERPISGVST